MTNQLTFGLMSGETQARPYAEGDVLVKHSGARYLVLRPEPEAYAEPALVCVALAHGGEAIVFEREIAYRAA